MKLKPGDIVQWSEKSHVHNLVGIFIKSVDIDRLGTHYEIYWAYAGKTIWHEQADFDDNWIKKL